MGSWPANRFYVLLFGDVLNFFGPACALPADENLIYSPVSHQILLNCSL